MTVEIHQKLGMNEDCQLMFCNFTILVLYKAVNQIKNIKNHYICFEWRIFNGRVLNYY